MPPVGQFIHVHVFSTARQSPMSIGSMLKYITSNVFGSPAATLSPLVCVNLRRMSQASARPSVSKSSSASRWA